MWPAALARTNLTEPATAARPAIPSPAINEDHRISHRFLDPLGLGAGTPQEYGLCSCLIGRSQRVALGSQLVRQRSRTKSVSASSFRQRRRAKRVLAASNGTAQ